jgi:hypothetical protein
VKPFRQEAFRSDGGNAIVKETDKEETETTELTRALINFKARDVYGNLMVEDQICSFYNHPRFLMYFNFIIKKAAPASELKQVGVALSDSLDRLASVKTFAVDVVRPKWMSLEAVFLNYTLYDGINYKNGMLVKYYTNNNFLGKPLYITRIPSTFVDSSEYNSNWYMFHK